MLLATSEHGELIMVLMEFTAYWHTVVMLAIIYVIVVCRRKCNFQWVLRRGYEWKMLTDSLNN
jgi:hypothetical protein